MKKRDAAQDSYTVLYEFHDIIKFHYIPFKNKTDREDVLHKHPQRPSLPQLLVSIFYHIFIFSFLRPEEV